MQDQIGKHKINFIVISKIIWFWYTSTVYFHNRYFYMSFIPPNTMNSVTLLMKIAITAATSIFCNDDIKSRDSVVFSITSHGRLLGELLFVTLKDVVGNCLYACMQHASCLTISYQQSSKRCHLMADVLFKENILRDPGWESYGHFESSLVSYFENYVLLCSSHRCSK